MEAFEGAVSVEQSADFVKECIVKRKALASVNTRVRGMVAQQEDSPTKELDAVMLGDAIVGYGGNMSLNNMAILENLINMSIMEANYEVPGGKNTQPWYFAFIKCLSDLGCYIADDGYSHYSESSTRVEMNVVIQDIVKGVLDGVMAKLPGAQLLGTVTSTTIDGLKDDKNTFNLFNKQAKTPKGARLSVIPCEQLENGLLVATSASIKQDGSNDGGGLLFVSWTSSAREIFRGKSFITYNPERYADIKDDIEEYLGEHRKEVLTKRFQRRKKK
jgi:hypothetical protein